MNDKSANTIMNGINIDVQSNENSMALTKNGEALQNVGIKVDVLTNKENSCEIK